MREFSIMFIGGGAFGACMNETGVALTVYFDGQFWAGVFERQDGERLFACKVTFGAEPKDHEVWEFILRHYYALKFSPAIKAERKQSADNPKRRQREEIKTERKKTGRERRDAEEQRRYELKQQKRKEKHRGH